MFGTVSSLTEAVGVCPICAEEYDAVSNLPRRLPCCEQHICEMCLDKISGGRIRFPCPVCRVDVNLPDGPKSLPKDMTVLRFLDVLKTRRDVLQTSTFRDISARRSTRPSIANVLGASSADLSQLQKKLDQVSLRMKSLSDSEGNIKKSQKKATELINQRFDDMVDELQNRRGILLSQVEAKADSELKSTRRALESHKTLQDELRSAITSGHSAASLQTPDDVGAERVGVSFTEVHMEQLLSSIRSAGQIRVISYSPAQRPSDVPADQLYNSVRFTPDDSPEAPQADVKLSIGGKDVIGPRLEFDHNMASANVQISSGVVSNTRPDPAPQDTGCRLQSHRRAVTLRPLPLKRGQVGVFSTRVVFTVKQLTGEGIVIWETSVTGAPVDGNYAQPTGLSVYVVSCPTHKQQLCLRVAYDGKLLTDVPLTKYQVGVSRDVNLVIVIDRDTNKIHVVDITDVKVVTTTEASLDRPLWVLTYVDVPSYCEMTSELISGRDLTLTPEMKHLLSSLI